MNTSIKIDHIAVMVNDLEKSLYFYRDLLGLEVVSPEEHNDGPISEMVAIPKVHMREYRLRAPDGIHGPYPKRRTGVHIGSHPVAQSYQPR